MNRYASRNPFPFHNVPAASKQDQYCTFARGVLLTYRKRRSLLGRLINLFR